MKMAKEKSFAEWGGLQRMMSFLLLPASSHTFTPPSVGWFGIRHRALMCTNVLACTQCAHSLCVCENVGLMDGKREKLHLVERCQRTLGR